MHVLSVLHTHVQCLCSTVLPNRCFGRCVRYTCWQTRFLCVRLSGSGCLTPPAPLVWRQVRWGHIPTVPSDLIPCEPSCCLRKPWLLYSVSRTKPWCLPKAFSSSDVHLHSFTWIITFADVCRLPVCKIKAKMPGLCSWHWYSWLLVSVSWLMAPSLAAFWGLSCFPALPFSPLLFIHTTLLVGLSLRLLFSRELFC